MNNYRITYSQSLGAFSEGNEEWETWSEMIAAPNGEEARRVAERRKQQNPNIHIDEIRRV